MLTSRPNTTHRPPIILEMGEWSLLKDQTRNPPELMPAAHPRQHSIFLPLQAGGQS
jgi:hypothetical protein